METNIDRVHEQVDRMLEKKYGHTIVHVEDTDDFLALKLRNQNKVSVWKQ